MHLYRIPALVLKFWVEVMLPSFGAFYDQGFVSWFMDCMDDPPSRVCEFPYDLGFVIQPRSKPKSTFTTMLAGLKEQDQGDKTAG